jgi:hypothetical protein
MIRQTAIQLLFRFIDPAVKMVEVLSSGHAPRLVFDVPSVTGTGRFSTFTLDLAEIWKGL